MLDRPYVKRSAWVGVESLPHVFYENFKTFSQRDLPPIQDAGRGHGLAGERVAGESPRPARARTRSTTETQSHRESRDLVFSVPLNLSGGIESER